MRRGNWTHIVCVKNHNNRNIAVYYSLFSLKISKHFLFVTIDLIFCKSLQIHTFWKCVDGEQFYGWWSSLNFMMTYSNHVHKKKIYVKKQKRTPFSINQVVSDMRYSAKKCNNVDNIFLYGEKWTTFYALIASHI